MKKFFHEFKAFITKGNIIDLAVAVVIGGAFGKIVTSLVNDIIMPLISLLVGGTSVADWKWVITPAVFENGVQVAAEAALHYGSFLQTIIDFLIISFFVFLALKIIMQAQRGFSELGSELKLASKKERRELIAAGHTAKEARRILKQKEEEAAEAAKKAEEDKKAEEKKNTPEVLLKEIRDLLKEQQNREN